MAFKATRKITPKPKTVKPESAYVEPPVMPVSGESDPSVSDRPVQDENQSAQVKILPEVSIDDLIGAPISSESHQARPVSTNREPAPGQSTNDQRVQSAGLPPVSGGMPQGTSRSENDGGSPESMSHNAPRGGYQRPGRFYGGYRRGGRRDFGGRSDNSSEAYRGNNGYTQDINVPTETVKGLLDIMPEGHGFLRPKYTPSERDVYISVSQIRRFLLRNGDVVEGQARAPKDNERYWGLLKVEKINEMPAEIIGERPKFEDLTPVYPNKLLRLETELQPLSTRIIDLVAPIGFGQRGLIVSPPKAGKTTILKEIAAGVSANYPDVHLMAALIGERPEEVTDISRSVKGEVLASNFDESPAEQTRIAEVALDRAKRLVEMGKDVVILLDSITRLARAYNLVVNPSGRTLSGGFDPAALYPAKRFLGAARCVEKHSPIGSQPVSVNEEVPGTGEKESPGGPSSGGSLTVIGTALVETGSRMDDLIYEEFKGTGNMELHLSRILQERRVFPAIDITRSGTRHDELLLGEEAMKKVTTLRHMLSMLSDEERTMMLIEKLGKTKSNEEFLESLAKG